MANDKSQPAPAFKHGRIVAQPGKPLEYVDVSDAGPSSGSSPLVLGFIETLAAYREAAEQLLRSKYANQKELAPPHMREKCNILVLCCNDGVLVRYDLLTDGKPMIRGGEINESLAKMSPQFSELLIHFPDDPTTYVPHSGGPEVIFSKIDETGLHEIARQRPVIYAATKMPDGYETPPPPARPPCLIAVQNEFDFQMHGVVVPSDVPLKLSGPDVQQFIAHSRFRLNVGWQTIEIYPLLSAEYWKPAYAATWAELDLLAVIAQKQLVASTLTGLDSRAATRKRYVELLNEFETLLAGPEEPVHQFLKAHPELLCPTSEHHWSKLAFGDRVSDFVFREPYNDYLLVEIEAPYRELFRKDGQQREELTHAINQILDWIQYIGDNRQKVETELGLVGISTNPRALIVIGRSESLTEATRQKLTTLQAQQNKLRILTYDDLIAGARANLERLLGPLTLIAQNAEIYFFKEPPGSST